MLVAISWTLVALGLTSVPSAQGAEAKSSVGKFTAVEIVGYARQWDSHSNTWRVISVGDLLSQSSVLQTAQGSHLIIVAEPKVKAYPSRKSENGFYVPESRPYSVLLIQETTTITIKIHTNGAAARTAIIDSNTVAYAHIELLQGAVTAHVGEFPGELALSISISNWTVCASAKADFYIRSSGNFAVHEGKLTIEPPSPEARREILGGYMGNMFEGAKLFKLPEYVSGPSRWTGPAEKWMKQSKQAVPGKRQNF